MLGFVAISEAAISVAQGAPFFAAAGGSSGGSPTSSIATSRRGRRGDLRSLDNPAAFGRGPGLTIASIEALLDQSPPIVIDGEAEPVVEPPVDFDIAETEDSGPSPTEALMRALAQAPDRPLPNIIDYRAIERERERAAFLTEEDDVAALLLLAA